MDEFLGFLGVVFIVVVIVIVLVLGANWVVVSDWNQRIVSDNLIRKYDTFMDTCQQREYSADECHLIWAGVDN